MAQLYIANATKQVIQFGYWPLERGRMTQPFVQMIPIGGQVRITPQGSRTDLSIREIDFIVDQHRKYGLISIDEIDSSKLPFQGMCYSVGDPVPPERLHRAMMRNEEALEEEGKQIRKEAALAVNDQIEKHLDERRLGENINKLEMSVTEVEPPGGYPGDHQPLGEGFIVTRSG